MQGRGGKIPALAFTLIRDTKDKEGQAMNWRKFGILILAAIIGSGFTTATYMMMGKGNKTIQVEHLSSTPVLGAAYTVNAEGEVVPLEFTDVAKRVTPAVVHIKSTMVSRGQEYGNGRTPAPFGDEFDNDFFRRFFGPEFRFEQPAPRSPQPRIGSGSGVIINSEGYVVTNNHVIQGADDIEVILNDNRTFKAKVVGADPSTDLALIRIKAEELPVPIILNGFITNVIKTKNNVSCRYNFIGLLMGYKMF